MIDTFFKSKLLNLAERDLNLYHVKFYDDKAPLAVKANSFDKAAILAMACVILETGVGWGVEYIENVKTGVKVPFDI